MSKNLSVKKQIKTITKKQHKALTDTLYTINDNFAALKELSPKSKFIENWKDNTITIKVPKDFLYLVEKNIESRRLHGIQYKYKALRYNECKIDAHEYRLVK